MKRLHLRIKSIDAPAYFWAYLLLVVAAEYSISVFDIQIGLLLHVGGLVIALIYAFGGCRHGRNRFGDLALALSLAPLIRLHSVLQAHLLHRLAGLLLFTFLLLLIAVICRRARLSPVKLGLHADGLLLQAMLIGFGPALAAIEYAALGWGLDSTSFVSRFTGLSTIITVVAIVVVEEIVFRGLLQTLALRVLGPRALIYVILLFTAMHFGQRSAVGLLFVFGLGAFFAYIVFCGRSIVGVSLAHVAADLSLLLVMPDLSRPDNVELRIATSGVIIVGALIGCIALGTIVTRAVYEGRVLPADGRPIIPAVDLPPPIPIGKPTLDLRHLLLSDASVGHARSSARFRLLRFAARAVLLALLLTTCFITLWLTFVSLSLTPTVSTMLDVLTLALLCTAIGGIIYHQITFFHSRFLQLHTDRSGRREWQVPLAFILGLLVIEGLVVTIVQSGSDRLWSVERHQLLVTWSFGVMMFVAVGGLAYGITATVMNLVWPNSENSRIRWNWLVNYVLLLITASILSVGWMRSIALSLLR